MGHITDQFREIIRASDETPTAIARRAGLAPSTLTRFLDGSRGKRGLSDDVIERLAEALGLEIVIRPKRRKER
jgi:transcriptional regulator with XRE-family HTH domain